MSEKSVTDLLRSPLAFVPMLMSAAGLALLIGYIAMFGLKPEEPSGDEGAPARLFQLLMGLQIPLVAIFLVKWLPRESREAMIVAALQLLCWVAAFVPVYLLEH